MSTPTRGISARLPLDLYERIARAAERESRTFSSMLRVLLFAGLQARGHE